LAAGDEVKIFCFIAQADFANDPKSRALAQLQTR
jgi:hypothetical protein